MFSDDLDPEVMRALLGGEGDPNAGTPGYNPVEGITVGARDSGRAEVAPGSRVGVLRAGLPQGIRTGLASVHVAVTEIVAPGEVFVAAPFQRLILHVRWQTGIAGGECDIDGNNGQVFTVGGVESLEIDASIVTPGPDVMVPGRTLIVEAVVHWKTAINPKATFITMPRIALGAGVESAPVIIPQQAAALLVRTTVPASAGTLEARIRAWITAGAPLLSTTLNPVANGTPLGGADKAVTFLSTVNMTITPMFELVL